MAASGGAPPAAPARTELYSKLLAVLFFMTLLTLMLLEAPWPTETTVASQEQTTPPLAELLFGEYGASFAMLSILMGVALFGGLFLAREDREEEEGAGDGGGAKAGAAKEEGAKGAVKGGEAKGGGAG